MALQGTFYDETTGLTIASAYVVIGQFRGDLQQSRFDVQIYASEAAYTSQLQPITTKGYSIETSAVSGVASLYVFLLSGSEYNGFSLVP
jgi:hypothetical protein